MSFPTLTPLEKAASGALASSIANTVVYPLDLLKTIIQTQVKKKVPSKNGGPPTPPSELDLESDLVFKQKYLSRTHDLKYKNTLDVLKKIYQKKGILGWYHGLMTTIVGLAIQNFSYFYWYTIVRRVYHQLRKGAAPLTLTELGLGALAAAISQLFTMPIGVVTTAQQTSKEHKNILQIAKEVYAHDGLSGFWRGLKVSLVLCINPSITYGSYERLKQVLFPAKKFLAPQEAFFLGMCAKLLATLATQPLIVSKAMLQKKREVKKDKQGNVIKEDDGEVHFDTFPEALAYLWKLEKISGLYKGVAPQLVKGVFVQGLLFMFKDQIDMLFVFLLQMLKNKQQA